MVQDHLGLTAVAPLLQFLMVLALLSSGLARLEGLFLPLERVVIAVAVVVVLLLLCLSCCTAALLHRGAAPTE
jgi:hypothetical protein